MRTVIPKSVRKAVKERFGGLCGYCGKPHDRLQVDHVVPFAREHWQEGVNPNRLENLMPACPSCNNYKTVLDLEEFRRGLERQVEQARKHSVNFRLAERFGLITAYETSIVFHFEKQSPKTAGKDGIGWCERGVDDDPGKDSWRKKNG